MQESWSIKGSSSYKSCATYNRIDDYQFVRNRVSHKCIDKFFIPLHVTVWLLGLLDPHLTFHSFTGILLPLPSCSSPHPLLHPPAAVQQLHNIYTLSNADQLYIVIS